jgi:hypothetical protein
VALEQVLLQAPRFPLSIKFHQKSEFPSSKCCSYLTDRRVNLDNLPKKQRSFGNRNWIDTYFHVFN